MARPSVFDIATLIVAFFIPPLGVLLKLGFSSPFWITLVLYVLPYYFVYFLGLPSIAYFIAIFNCIYALYVIYVAIRDEDGVQVYYEQA